jgi:hypothetical protein
VQNTQVVAESFRQSFAVATTTNGTYSGDRITFGVVPVGVREDPGIGAITVLVESTTTNAVVELWLARVQDGSTPASTIEVTDADFFYSGHALAGLGSFTHPLAAWPGAQIRVKGGGTVGDVVVSARSVRGASGGTLV